MELKSLFHSLPAPIKKTIDRLSYETKGTVLLKAFSFTKVPLLFLTNPKVISLTDEACEIVIPFQRLVKNHLGSLYFGALAIGADACIGMAAMDEINKSGKELSLVFKDFKAEFLKRAEGDCVFVCSEKKAIKALVEKALSDKARVHQTFNCGALVNGEMVAQFELTLSIKPL